jgi:hypothetical protein
VCLLNNYLFSTLGKIILKTFANEQPLLILIELTEHKKTTTCDIGHPCPGMEQVQKCGGAKPGKACHH